MAVDPKDFVGDLTTDGTDTLTTVSQDNNLDDRDVVSTPGVNSDGQLTQTVTVNGGDGGDGPGGAAGATTGNGVTNGGGSDLTVGDDLKLTGHAAAAADAEAAARAFTQDIETGGNAQGNYLNIDVVGSNLSVDDVGEDDEDSGAPDDDGVFQLGPDGPIGETLSGLAFPESGAGTDNEILVSQSNTLDDRDTVTDAEVVNNDDINPSDFDVEQMVTANGGDATSGIGIDITGAPLFNDSSIGDDLTIEGITEASADALAEAEAFTQEISTGDNLQINSIEATVIGGNQSIASTGEDDAESVDLVADNEDDTETFFGSSQQGDEFDNPISQTNMMDDNEDGAFSILNPLVLNDANTSAEASQTVVANGGNAATDDGIDTDDGASNILSNVTVGDNLSITGSAHASADATATAEAFTQAISSGGNAQQNSFAAAVISGSQNDIDVGEDNAGSPGFSDPTIAPQDTIDEPEDTETNFDVDQLNTMNDDDDIVDPNVINGDIPDGDFDGGSSLVQSATAMGGNASADDGIDADGLFGDAIDVDVGDDATVSGTSATDASATAAVTAFTQDLDTGGNTQINDFAAEVIGGSQTTIDVGEDDTEDLAMLRSDDGITVTNVDVDQTNDLDDADTISDPTVFNDAGSTLEQTATAEGGEADSDDGITVIGSGDDFFNSPSTVDDDLAISGMAEAHADATASADAFTQAIVTGGNGQLNDFDLNVVGASQNITDIAGDNAGDADDANSELLGAGGPTITDVNLAQSNVMDDQDVITTPEVQNDFDPDPDGSGSVVQTVTATGGDDPGTGFSGDAAGIDAEGLDDSIAFISVGDDASISGSTNATADAVATARAFTQDVHTGGNTQVNVADISVVGGNQNGVLTGEDDAEGVDLSADADGETATTLGNFVFEDGMATTDDPITQSNVLNDQDDVIDALVENQNGGTVTQTVIATGGEPTVSDGITLGDVGEVVQISGSVGDDLDISGDASATADALAYAEAFTQDIHTGGNVQLNDFSASIVGGSENIYAAGDDDGGSGADDVDPGFAPAEFGLVEGTNTQISLDQSNSLDDRDEVLNPEVLNIGAGGPDGTVNQTAMATGGTNEPMNADNNGAVAGDGIGGGGGASGSFLVEAGTVGDDLSIAGSTNASADGTAALEAFTQDIHTGGNAQYNVADVTIVGGNASTLAAGEDDEAEGTLDIGNVSVLGGTDTQMSIVQSNGGPGMGGTQALDQDLIDDALVSNTSPGDGGLEGLNQDADAFGGDATVGSGINTAGGLVNSDVGDDASVSGMAHASSEAAALTEGFAQGLTTGENRQVNEASAAIVGANQNANLTGGDDLAGGDDTMIAGLTGDADSLFIIDQSNNLNDSDEILNPTVESDNGDTDQNAASTGGNATSGYGINATGVGGGGQTDDDFTITGETIASADALSDVSAFTQDIDTGGNVQANSANLSVVGYNDSLMFTGEDDGDDATDLPALSPLVPTDIGEPDGETGSDGDGVDTTFDVTQINALTDNDTVMNPQVFSDGPDSETTQTVTATGGTAMSLDGVAGSGGGLFDSYTVLDDLSIEGVSEASANAYGAADAFTQNIVLGANVQVNTVDVSVVGGSTAVNVVGEDDLMGS